MFPFMHLKIKDKSMEPNFKEGDFVIANKLAYLFSKPSKGDIIIFKHPKEKNKFLIKRVYLTTTSDEYFVVGDNKDYSSDSRHFGAIKKNLIVGKLLMHIKKSR